MRISENEKHAIINTAQKIYNSVAAIYLFGSRVDNKKSGGDIDIYIKLDKKLENTDKINKKLDFITQLMLLIGDQKIDLVINDNSDDKLIYKIAEKEGIRLW